jgi:uncharacterized protein (TIGR03118 family)
MAHNVARLRTVFVTSPAVRLLVASMLCGAAVVVGSTPAAATAGHHRPRAVVAQVNLVSDIPGAAALTDPNLVNPWGLALGPATPLWAADNGTDVASIYTGGQPGTPVGIAPLVVKIPGGAPTGQVFNGSDKFVLATGGKTGPARFIFDSEGGDLTAWNPTGDPTTAVTVAHTADAIYKGLALLDTGHGPVLLAADFHGNRIDVFDQSFHPVHAKGAFCPAGIPRGYGAFNVAVLGDQVFVTYAKQDADAEDDVAGPGLGFVNVFDRHGNLVRHFARRGVLNAPWGLAIAPDSFGKLAGDVLVGNFGDGRIHVFNRRNGHLRATLRRPNGAPVSIEGLWALQPGTATSGGTDAVWFSAGPDDEQHGLLGLLRPTH